MKYFLILIGGATGALSRVIISELIEKSQFLFFPLGINSVNILGCFLLGILINLIDPKYEEVYEPNGMLHDETTALEDTEYLFISNGPVIFFDDKNFTGYLGWEEWQRMKG